MKVEQGRVFGFASVVGMLLLLEALFAVGFSVYLVQSAGVSWLACGLLLQGCVLLVSLPARFNVSLGKPQGRAGMLFWSGVAVVALSGMVYLQLIRGAGDWTLFLYLWIVVAGAIVLAARCAGGTNSKSFDCFDPTDTWLFTTILLIAFLLRAWCIVTRSPIAIDDEMDVFGEGLMLFKSRSIPPFIASGLAFPFLFHWLALLAYPAVAAFIDLLTFEKLLASFVASAGVAAWYLIIRLYQPRHIALGGAVLLTCFGWHWLNSRFLYAYPFDLGNVSLSVLFLLLGLRLKRSDCIALSALFAAMTLAFQKIGFMTVPFAGLIFLEFFLTEAKPLRKKLILFAGLWGLVVFILTLPFILTIFSHLPDGQWFSRQSGIMGGRSAALAAMGTSPVPAFFSMYGDVFYQLYIGYFDSIRHIFRGGSGLLDPVFAVLFSVGFIFALKTIARSQSSRLCFAGLVIFALPMVLSFPAESGNAHGVGRRMLGVSFFVAWLGALGADVVASRLLPERKQAVATVALCGLSAFLNVSYLFSSYLSPAAIRDAWEHKDLAIQRASCIATVRQLAKAGSPVLYLSITVPIPGALNRPYLKSATKDLPNVREFDSLETLRAAMGELKGQGIFVVIPNSNMVLSQGYQDLPAQLSDLIPTYLWNAVLPDLRHIPTVRYAYVKL